MPALIETTSAPPADADGGAADLSLLGRFIDTGDPAAFAAIVERYGRVVFATALRILGDPGGAQDVSQETFYRLMKQPRAVQTSLAGWLHRSATHLALDVRRSETARRNRERTYGQDRPESRPGGSSAGHPGVGESGAEESTWAEVCTLVDAAVDELEEPARMLVVRHFLQGVRQDHLAAELHLSPATVSRRIKHALGELHSKLTARGVRLGAVALAVALLESSKSNASAAFVTGMAKMRLVVSLRSPPAGPPPVRFPTPYTLPPDPQPPLTRGKTMAIYAVCLVILALMVAGVVLAWVRSLPNPPPAPPAPATASMHDDR